MAECEKSTMEVADDDDLEDGEIEDDDDEVEEVKPEPPKNQEKDSQRKTLNIDHKSSPSSSSSKKSRLTRDDEEEDIASSIANAIAENLKRQGIEPPMPNVKKSSDPEYDQQKKQSKGARKRRRRRERNEKEKEDAANGKKRSKVTEDDGFYMVGGSPQRGDGSESDGSSYTSNESEDLNRMTYEERRAKRRERHRQAAGRERERERERGEKRRRSRSRSRSRSRDRDRRERRRERERERDSEKEVCLRFAEYGHCPDDDCNRSHDVRQPKKMELCKFWLMECCVKREKCSYMHGDFPCKYYYLGMKCTTKDCKFKHGRPLEENIKQILLKHLDSAPKEILGDFPRIGRENASKMLAETHIKLCQEFNIPCPEATDKKIPSLLDMTIKPPDSRFLKNKNRWDNSPLHDDKPSTSVTNEPPGPGDVKLANLNGILSDKQIDSMAAIGVITVSQINNLTVAQLNELGLSFATIGEIQATAMNMGNKPLPKIDEKVDENVNSEDVDLRANFNNSDIDMRHIPTVNNETIKSPSSTIMSPNQSDVEEIYKKPETPQHKPNNVLMSPPSGTLDLSQYLKDSNLANDDEEENEDGLRIDENYCTSDYEQEEKKDSQSEDDQQAQEEMAKPFDLLPPSFDSSNFLKATTTKIDISSSVSQLMEMDQPKLPATLTESPSRDPRSRDPRDPRKNMAKESPKLTEISSPTYRDPRKLNKSSEVVKPATSIYEIESPSEEDDITINLDKDKDMRFNFMNSENGDVDLRFPFTPMANFIPATEIDAAYGVHVFDTFQVSVVDIPKPDYSEIKRSFRQMENTQDPRLKKLFGFGSESGQKNADVPTIKSPTLPMNSNAVPSDPRKRRAQEQEMAGPKKLQISTILQNSQHYNELSSSQKMVVNEVLAELTKELKAFHANPTLNKIFDSSFITQRPKLQQVLIGLGVFVNNEGDFEEIKQEVPSIPQTLINMAAKMQIPPPMIPNLAPAPLISLNQPPPNFPLNLPIRSGMHSIATNIQNLPFASNIIEQNEMNFQAMNQMPFGDHYNINRNVGGGGNNHNNKNNNNNMSRNSQRSQNFRNNNKNNMNRNNNNFSRKRRN